MNEAFPSINELQDWNLIALRQLGGTKRINKIDARIRGMLSALGVSEPTLDRTRTDDRRTDLERKAELARSAAKKRELIENVKWGHWRLTAKGRAVADEVITNKEADLARIIRTQRLQAEAQEKQLAATARVAIGKIRLLQKYNITVADLEKLLKSRVRGHTVPVKPGSDHKWRMDVEREVIDYVRSKEPKVWHTTPPGNPGFDLYQTQDDSESGKKTVWCEVKSLSKGFPFVSLTPREIEEALKRRDAYWLYIVDIGQDNPDIFRIQNPARRPGVKFTYGTEWRHQAQ